MWTAAGDGAGLLPRTAIWERPETRYLAIYHLTVSGRISEGSVRTAPPHVQYGVSHFENVLFLMVAHYFPIV